MFACCMRQIPFMRRSNITASTVLSWSVGHDGRVHPVSITPMSIPFAMAYVKSCRKTKNQTTKIAHDVIVLKLEKFVRTMLLCSRVPTYIYICGSSGQNSHTEEQFVYSNGLLQIIKEVYSLFCTQVIL